MPMPNICCRFLFFLEKINKDMTAAPIEYFYRYCVDEKKRIILHVNPKANGLCTKKRECFIKNTKGVCIWRSMDILLVLSYNTIG